MNAEGASLPIGSLCCVAIAVLAAIPVVTVQALGFEEVHAQMYSYMAEESSFVPCLVAVTAAAGCCGLLLLAVAAGLPARRFPFDSRHCFFHIFLVAAHCP